MKVPAEVVTMLSGICTEIGAGKSFGAGKDAEIWNSAHDRCLSIVNAYKRGDGLFQMTGNTWYGQPAPKDGGAL